MQKKIKKGASGETDNSGYQWMVEIYYQWLI